MFAVKTTQKPINVPPLIGFFFMKCGLDRKQKRAPKGPFNHFCTFVSVIAQSLLLAR